MACVSENRRHMATRGCSRFRTWVKVVPDPVQELPGVAVLAYCPSFKIDQAFAQHIHTLSDGIQG